MEEQIDFVHQREIYRKKRIRPAHRSLEALILSLGVWFILAY